MMHHSFFSLSPSVIIQLTWIHSSLSPCVIIHFFWFHASFSYGGIIHVRLTHSSFLACYIINFHLSPFYPMWYIGLNRRDETIILMNDILLSNYRLYYDYLLALLIITVINVISIWIYYLLGSIYHFVCCILHLFPRMTAINNHSHYVFILLQKL